MNKIIVQFINRVTNAVEETQWTKFKRPVFVHCKDGLKFQAEVIAKLSEEDKARKRIMTVTCMNRKFMYLYL